MKSRLNRCLALILLAWVLSGALFPRAYLPEAQAAPAAVKRGLLYDMPVSDGANVFSDNLTHSVKGVSTAFRITVAVSGTDSTLIVRLDGSQTDYNLVLNNGTALTAGNLYTFTLGVEASLGYNIRVGTATTLAYLLIEEVVDEAL